MNYSARCELKLRVGIAADIHATAPEKTIVCEHFNYAGNGKVPLLGKWADGRLHTESMEFGYDLTDLTRGFDATQPLKYFIQVETKGDAIGAGKIEKMTLMNYEFDEVRETIAGNKNVDIMNGGATTLVAAVMPGGKAIPSKYIPCKNWTLLSCNSQENSSTRDASNVIDGDLNTFWHTRWSRGTDPFPHELVVDMGKNYELNSFEYFPRQDGGKNGHIGEYELYLADDRDNWGDPVAAGNWTYSSFSKVISFNTQTARYFKMVSKSEASSGAWSSVAEFRFLAMNGQEENTGVSDTSENNLKVWYHSGLLHINNLKKGGMISLLNITGREVFADQINRDNPVITLPMTKGIYLVVVIDGADKHCKKIVVR